MHCRTSIAQLTHRRTNLAALAGGLCCVPAYTSPPPSPAPLTKSLSSLSSLSLLARNNYKYRRRQKSCAGGLDTPSTPPTPAQSDQYWTRRRQAILASLEAGQGTGVGQGAPQSSCPCTRISSLLPAPAPALCSCRRLNCLKCVRSPGGGVGRGQPGQQQSRVHTATAVHRPSDPSAWMHSTQIEKWTQIGMIELVLSDIMLSLVEPECRLDWVRLAGPGRQHRPAQQECQVRRAAAVLQQPGQRLPRQHPLPPVQSVPRHNHADTIPPNQSN